MVIQSNELKTRVLENNIKVIQDLEKRIDSELEKNFVDESSKILVSLPSANSQPYDSGTSITTPVINEIMKMYKQAGWNVKYNSDQREGNSLTFQIHNITIDYYNK